MATLHHNHTSRVETVNLTFCFQISLKVLRKFGSVGQVRLGFTTHPGSASSLRDREQDFRAQSGFLSFTPGQSEATISIAIVNDMRAEGPENFFVNLTSIELLLPT